MKTLKLILFAIGITVIIPVSYAQNVGINDDNSQPDESAMLDIKSSDKGLLIPRVQLNDINNASPVTNPATGLLIYANTSSAVDEGFYYWNGDMWIKLITGEGIADNDADSTNEIQHLNLSGDVLSLTKDDTIIDLSKYLDNTDDQTLQEVLTNENSAGSLNITNLAEPVSAQDAATKNYVDNNDDVNDADSDPTNEIQYLRFIGNSLWLTEHDSIIDLSKYLDNTDNQTLSLNGLELSISGGNLVTLPSGSGTIQDLSSSKTGHDVTVNISDGGSGTTFSVADEDSSVTNELQTLSLSNDTLFLSQGNNIRLPSNTSLWDTTGNDIFYNNGNVGIGLSIPNYKLHLYNGNMSINRTDQGAWLQIKSEANSNGDASLFLDCDEGDESYISFREEGVYKWSIWTDNTDNFFIGTDNGSEEKLIIDALGNVSIGQSIPTSKLDIRDGSVRIWDGTANIDHATSNGELYVENDLEVDGDLYVNGNKVTSGHSIGESYGGGIIFYVDGTGQHGLIAATSDQSTATSWGCAGTDISVTDSEQDGEWNTYEIITNCTTTGIAAKLCADLSLNGYTDWYLPSLDELDSLYQQRASVGGFASSRYWSSTEFSGSVNTAQAINFSDGSEWEYTKSYNCYVRAIRKF